MNHRLLPEAEDEAMEAARWYDNQRAGLGQELFDELDAAISRIRNNPGPSGGFACRARTWNSGAAWSTVFRIAYSTR
jgi:hypothetical protein